MDNTRLLLVRHGQTQANADACFLGQHDVPVTELGAEQSRRAVAGVVAWAPERIVTSPLARCRELIAEPAARELGVELVVDERIQEFDFGPLENVPFTEVSKRGLVMPWGPGSERWKESGGSETFDEFLARIGTAADELAASGTRTAVILHGGVIRGLIARWLEVEVGKLNRFDVENVNGFILEERFGSMHLKHFGLDPAQFGDYR